MLFAVVVTVKETANPDEAHRLAAPEALAVWDMHKKNTLRSIYHRADRPGAVCLMECDSAETLKKELAKLPMKDILDFQTIPLKPYEGYEAIWFKK